MIRPGGRAGGLLGELPIGTELGIKQNEETRCLMRKIGGTCQAALGRAYPESGGTNEFGTA